MKNNYFAVTIQEKEKNYAFVMKISENENIAERIKRPSIIIAQLCSTKKAADRVVNHWNACYKANGEYMFDDFIIQ